MEQAAVPGDDAGGGTGRTKKKLIDYLQARQDHSELSCDGCREAEALDRQIPMCKQAAGCPIPTPPEGYDRWYRIHEHCQTLRGLATADTIFRLHNVTIDDLDFLAIIHQETPAHQE